MDKGIRPEARRKFAELNAKRLNGEFGTDDKANTKFRKEVMSHLMDQFGITLASAATHYNEAFKFIKSQDANAVAGLGRADDKKGGRKPKAKPEAAATPAAEQTAAPVEAAAAPAVKLCIVKRQKDDAVIATGLTNEQALALVDKAAKAKKAKLYVVDEQ